MKAPVLTELGPSCVGLVVDLLPSDMKRLSNLGGCTTRLARRSIPTAGPHLGGTVRWQNSRRSESMQTTRLEKQYYRDLGAEVRNEQIEAGRRIPFALFEGVFQLG